MTATSDPRIDALLALAYAAAKENAEYWYGDVNGPAKRWVESDSYAALKTALEAAVLEPLSVVPTEPEQLPIGHLHSNGDFCQERQPEGFAWWPIPLYAHPALTSLVPSSGETQASGA